MNRKLARENWDAWSPEFMEIWYSGNYFAPISTLEPLNSSFTLKFVRSSTWGNMTTGTMTIMNSNKIPVSRCCPNVCFETSRQFRKYLWLECSPKDGASDSRIRSFGTVLCFFLSFSLFSFFPLFLPATRRSHACLCFSKLRINLCRAYIFPPMKKRKKYPRAFVPNDVWVTR